MITATNLTKRYNGKPVVDQVSFQVSPGEIVGVIGPNGAGKSTLLGMLAGTVSPSSGEVTICGQNLTRRPGAAAGMVGYVPQEIALHPALPGQQRHRSGPGDGRVCAPEADPAV